jgi:hypothetical protein
VRLTGTGESGKSTIWKQIKIVHANGYTDKELQEKSSLVLLDLFNCVTQVLENQNIERIAEEIQRIKAIDRNNIDKWTTGNRKDLAMVAKHPAFKAAFQRKRYNVSDSAP